MGQRSQTAAGGNRVPPLSSVVSERDEMTSLSSRAEISTDEKI